MFKVGPRSRDQALRTIRQDEAQLEAVVPVHHAHDDEILALEGMVGSHDAHLFRKVPDVGSVSPTPLASSIMPGLRSSSSTASRTSGSSAS